MPVLQHSNDRLRIACVRFDNTGAFLDLDRTRNSAAVYRLAGFLPFRRISVSLSDIIAAHIGKRERGYDRASYGVVLRRRLGDDIKIGCSSRDDALSLLQTIAGFLDLHDS